MIHPKTNIRIDNNIIEAQAPIIISASRATDIPAFYSDWFSKRLEVGYLKWINPFNGVPLYISFENARLIIFWTKDASQIIDKLDYLNEKNINYYFQFTINDYDVEKFEPRVPTLKFRIDTFKRLTDKIGKEKVIWRFDPLLLSDITSIDSLVEKIYILGEQIKDYTNKFVFSFADIEAYNKVKNNFSKEKIKFKEVSNDEKFEFAEKLQNSTRNWNIPKATYAENIALRKDGI